MNILNPLEIFGTRLRPKIPVTRSAAAAILHIMTQPGKIPPPTRTGVMAGSNAEGCPWNA